MCDTLTAAGVTPIYSTFRTRGRSRRVTSTTASAASSTRRSSSTSSRSRAPTSGPDSPVSFQKQFVEPVERMKQLVQYTNDDAASRGYGDGNLAFANGEAAMYLQGPWAIGEIAKSNPEINVGAFPLPVTEDPDGPQGPGQHRPGPVDPGGLDEEGGGAGVPVVPHAAGRHRRLQRPCARLRRDQGRGTGDERDAGRAAGVLRPRRLLPGRVPARPAVDPAAELHAVAGHRRRAGADPAHARRGLVGVWPSVPDRPSALPAQNGDTSWPPAPPPDRHGAAATRRRAGDQANARSGVNRTFYLMLCCPRSCCSRLAITVPAIMGITLSFTDSVGFGEFSWVGLTNYVAMFTRPGDPQLLHCSPSGSRS